MEEIVRSVAIVKINEIIEYLIEKGATKEDLEDIVVAAGAVTSVHGRRGNVVSRKGDYTAEQVGAAPEKHAAQHLPNGKDPIDFKSAGLAEADHVHGNIGNKGNIGNVNGKIVVTGFEGVLEAKDKIELGLAMEPTIIATSGDVAFTLENNKEYEYTGVTSLNITGANVSCHGTIVFGDAISSIIADGFSAVDGDDIEKAKANETWEFDCFANRIIWKNWGVV